MILEELKKVVRDEREKGRSAAFIRNALKEYLQVYILSFVYTSAEYNKAMIFTGGTCLRHFYGLERLSEDVDFDFLSELDTERLAENLERYFVAGYKFSDVAVSLKQQGRQVLIKFPVLDKLELAFAKGSRVLYVKMDLSPVPSMNYKAIVSSQSRYGFNYVARHYDLPDLFAGKIHAILRRKLLKGRDHRPSVKGRDYFDLLWFLRQKIKPNFKRLSDMLGEQLSVSDVVQLLRERVYDLNRMQEDFKADVLPLVQNPNAIGFYVDNYREEFFRYIDNVEW